MKYKIGDFSKKYYVDSYLTSNRHGYVTEILVRDNGPVFVYNSKNQLTMLDWGFNGWEKRLHLRNV